MLSSWRGRKVKIIKLRDALTHFAADQQLAARYVELCHLYPSTGPDPGFEDREERARIYFILLDNLKGMLSSGELRARGYWAGNKEAAEPPAAWWTDARIDTDYNTATADYEMLKGVQIYQSSRLSARLHDAAGRQKPPQEEFNRAMLDLARGRGRKIKQHDPEARTLLDGLGATTRQILAAFRSLPPEYSYKKGRPHQIKRIK
jgi:hypothetical protein